MNLKMHYTVICFLLLLDDLVIKESGCYLSAKQVWGALRGLETLSQLIVKSPDGDVSYRFCLLL